MKGVAYQQDTAAAGGETKSDKFIDPLADEDSCKRDVPLLKKLDTNTIRVYAIDPSKNHDDCMKQLQDAGIYVVADLSEPNISINREDPEWKAVTERTQANGPIVSKVDSVFLETTDFSPLK